ncbi:MAG: hypothetical protein BWY95_01823 [Bacteroidetes bacterium ADurb.BinA104]|nr:MAG: hypothetical protein BWY95_01823 [Bacteroidetes bacterium ADurb.BinA104]
MVFTSHKVVRLCIYRVCVLIACAGITADYEFNGIGYGCACNAIFAIERIGVTGFVTGDTACSCA